MNQQEFEAQEITKHMPTEQELADTKQGVAALFEEVSMALEADPFPWNNAVGELRRVAKEEYDTLLRLTPEVISSGKDAIIGEILKLTLSLVVYNNAAAWIEEFAPKQENQESPSDE